MAHDNQDKVAVTVIPLNTKEGTLLGEVSGRYMREDGTPLTQIDAIQILGIIDIALHDHGYERETMEHLIPKFRRSQNED